MNWELIATVLIPLAAGALILVVAAVLLIENDREWRRNWDALRDFADAGNESAQEWLAWARAHFREPKDRR